MEPGPSFSSYIANKRARRRAEREGKMRAEGRRMATNVKWCAFMQRREEEEARAVGGMRERETAAFSRFSMRHPARQQLILCTRCATYMGTLLPFAGLAPSNRTNCEGSGYIVCSYFLIFTR